MIHVRLLPNQVPKFWDIIKYASAKSGGLEEDHMAPHFNRLLYMLLNGKAQCFIRLTNERILAAVCITTIILDKVRDEKSLIVSCLYSFQKSQDDAWKEGFKLIKDFAISIDCKDIIAESSNHRAWEIYNILGLKERFRSFSISL